MVRIITDSAADFEPRELQQLNITCIPLTITFGDQAYQDGIELNKSRFYEKLLDSGDFPKTAQPAPALLEELFTQAHEAGEEAVYITLSSGLSGTYQTARMICGDLEFEGCHVVDGLNATGGQRLLVEYACKLRDEGRSAAQIAEAVEALRGRVRLFACINTLEYLYRGGRISHTVYKVGNLAQIKPIITVDQEGRVTVPGKAMGMRKGMDTLCKYLDSHQPDPGFPVYLMYTNQRSVAETLGQRMEDHGHCVSADRIIGVGAAIGTHIGPEACGVVYIEKE